MDNIFNECNQFWETDMFSQTEDFNRVLDEAFSGSFNSSSPEGASSSMDASKNILSERNRRKKLNDELLALRAAVPNITKASVIRDAVSYIQELREKEKTIEAKLSAAMGCCNLKKKAVVDVDDEGRTDTKNRSTYNDSTGSGKSVCFPIEIIDPLRPMDNIFNECNQLWETDMVFQTEDFDSWVLDKAFSGSFDSSSPDGASLSMDASKNILSERNRRKKLNDGFLALRAAVPNITKMDKASVIRDAVNYIQELREREKTIEAKLSAAMESCNLNKNAAVEGRTDTKNRSAYHDSTGSDESLSFPVEIMELSVNHLDERTTVVSLSCINRTNTIWKISRVIESLNLNILTSTINVASEKLSTTLFIQAAKAEGEEIKTKIETAIVAVSSETDLPSP